MTLSKPLLSYHRLLGHDRELEGDNGNGTGSHDFGDMNVTGEEERGIDWATGAVRPQGACSSRASRIMAIRQPRLLEGQRTVMCVSVQGC
jgi:hypothetical protein